MKKPILFIHIDVDNMWILEEEYGVPAGISADVIFTQALPDFLEIFNEFGVKCTLFVVGKDLHRLSARTFFARALANGHKLANHTESHLVGFGRLSAAKKEREILTAHERIKQIAGTSPIGFRGPGYFIDNDIVRVLQSNGYKYDTTVLPGPATLLMGAYLSRKKGSKVEKTFGRARDFLAPRRPGRMRSMLPGRAGLMEYPISTAPFLRFPIHSTFVYQLGTNYLNWALKLLRTETGPHVYLFHALDMLDYPQDGGLATLAVPLRWKFERRRAFIRSLIADFSNHFSIETTEGFVAGNPA